MKKLLIVALVLGCIAFTACEKKSVTTVASDQPVYDRVNQTGMIKCGYAIWAPAMIIDPNTKQLSGIFYDEMEEIGKRLNLKIVWASEEGWATAIESVKNQRIDMACSDFWASSIRARQVEFTAPVYYSTANVWVRSDETRNFTSLADLNTEQISYGTIDGSAEGRALRTSLPKAKAIALPELDTAADEMQGLRDKKYDFIAIDDASMNAYLAKNPGLFKKILPNEPVTMFPEIMMLRAGETKLKAMLDNTINEIQYDGTLAKIVEKYNAISSVKLPAKPYQD
jgi:ABC-type amino acid transport substrate-binding protein